MLDVEVGGPMMMAVFGKRVELERQEGEMLKLRRVCLRRILWRISVLVD